MATAAVLGDDLDSFIEAYERRRHHGGPAELGGYLPALDHPLYAEVLRELVRVDLELAWQSGVPRRIETYLEKFPALRDDPEALAAIGFEELRQRRQAGEHPSDEEYRVRFGVAPDSGAIGEMEEPLDELARGAAEYLRNIHSTAKDDPQAPPPTKLFAALHRDRPGAARALAESVTRFPPVGQPFMGFDLEAELGRGAFGRVYLARQHELAGRRVVVKVTADAATESQALAQLQHTNIAPIYAIHRSPPHDVIVMPFCGGTTLLDVTQALRLCERLPERGHWLVELVRSRATRFAVKPMALGPLDALAEVSYEQAVLRLAVKLARGLAHAHERGLWHRDLKPANVVLADDGEPMLVDFNLAEGDNLRGRAEAAHIGGTLPYMAPEQLQSFDDGMPRGDARSDVYAFGLVLFELLTGRFPFALPTGPLDTICKTLLIDRRGAVPRVRAINRRVSPALEAIVAKCLAPEPADRYESATELVVDLERQRDSQPLLYAPNSSIRERASKWIARHPRLTSGYAVTAVATLILAGVAAYALDRQREVTRAGERDAERAFQEDREVARRLLAGPVVDPPTIQRGYEAAIRAASLPNAGRAGYGDACLTAARATRLRGEFHGEGDGWRRPAHGYNDVAESAWEPGRSKRAVWLQRALLDNDLDRLQLALAEPVGGAQDEMLVGVEYLVHGEYRNARQHLEASRRLDATRMETWKALGKTYDALGMPEKAATCFETAIALKPDAADLHDALGSAFWSADDHKAAESAYDAAIRLDPDNLTARVNRGMNRLAVKNWSGALADLSEAIDREYPLARVWFARARVKQAMLDAAGATADRAEGFRRPAKTEFDWIARGVARLPGDPKAALDEFRQGLEKYPTSRRLLLNVASVADEYLKDPTAAIAALDEVLKQDPDAALAYAGRGVLLARQGRDPEARRDAEAALRSSDRPAIAYQVAGIFALLSKQKPADRDRAIYLLADALHRGYGLSLVSRDPDLAAIRDSQEVRKLLADVRTWKK